MKKGIDFSLSLGGSTMRSKSRYALIKGVLVIFVLVFNL
jgi:hypothetical protein